MEPVTVSLSIRVRIWREGRLWVADCPALGVTSQGKTEREAKANFGEALEAAIEVSRDMGALDALLAHAASHPETLWDEIDDDYRMTDFALQMPLSDFIAARGKADRPRA